LAHAGLDGTASTEDPSLITDDMTRRDVVVARRRFAWPTVVTEPLSEFSRPQDPAHLLARVPSCACRKMKAIRCSLNRDLFMKNPRLDEDS